MTAIPLIMFDIKNMIEKYPQEEMDLIEHTETRSHDSSGMK